MKRIRMIIVKVLIVFCILYFCYGAFLYYKQRDVLFPGTHLDHIPNVQFATPYYTPIWLKTDFGKVEAWYLNSQGTNITEKRPTVIFSHGNYELIGHWAEALWPYVQLGFNILLIEYPGFGKSEGKPSQKTISEAFTAGYDWLIQQEGVDTDQILAHGRSIGGGAACILAKERKIKAVIVQSTFTDINFFAHRYFLPSFLLKDSFDNKTILESFTGPTLIMHGEYDELIPVEHGKELSKVSQNNTFVSYPCGHNDFPPDIQQYWMDIHKFLVKANFAIKTNRDNQSNNHETPQFY